MKDMKNGAEAVLNGEMTIIDYICERSARSLGSEKGETRPNDLAYWEMVRDAQKNGKKLIFTAGPAPMEIIYAMDCVPLYLDLLPARLSEDVDFTSKLINEAETHSNAALCSLNKANTGVMLSGKLGLEPDAFVTVPIPCDSARAVGKALGQFIEAPTFNFDVSLHKNEQSLQYLEMQLEHFIGFLENLTGSKLDWEKVKQCMARADKASELFEKCVLLRRNKPCPMSSHMPLWNELMNALAPTEMMEKLLTAEIELCYSRLAKGESPCPAGEKHRVLLIHNLLWQGLDITDWFETEYGSVTVMDGFCFGKREYFDARDDRQECMRTMTNRMLNGSRAHGSGVSGSELFEAIEGILRDYEPDVIIFMGSVGCKHVWAGSKIVADSINEKYGLPVLSLGIDNTDRRYKSERDIKIALSEYMDTVVNKK